MQGIKRNLDDLNAQPVVSSQFLGQSFKAKSDFINYFSQCLQVSIFD